MSFEIRNGPKGNEKITVRILGDEDTIIICNLDIREKFCEINFLIWREEVNVVS